MTNFIPNAVSTEDLKKAMERAKSPREVLMNGMSIGQLFEFLEANDLNLSQFGDDAPIIDKFRILIGLDRLKRMHSKVVDITEKNPGQFLVKSEVTMEIKGTDKPACIAETLSMWVT